MTQIMLKTDELKPSKSNVRPSHTKEDIAMMSHSIKLRGIRYPLSVAKNGDGSYEIIAGRLRFEGGKKAGITEFPCEDVSELSEAERVDLSMSENVHRKEMSVMQRYSAFNRLFKAGMTVEKIGERFRKTVREVQQLLAIGSLPQKILDLYTNEEIGDRTLQALAITTGANLVRYSKLASKDRPRDWDIQNWLAGEKGMFMARDAIFDLDKYVGPKVIDLFAKEDEEWLTDGEQFIVLQTTACNEKITAYEKKGWKVIEVEYFSTWMYEKVAKAKGGQVYWCKDTKSGAVEFHVGYKAQGKAGAAPKAKGSDGKPEAQPEISQAFSAYIRQVRHNGVRAELLDDNKAALVVNICLMLKSHDSWRMDGIGMGAVKGEAYETDIADSLDYAAMEKAFVKIQSNADPVLLYRLKESELLNRLAVITAWRWQTYDNKFSDKVAKTISLVDVQNWQPTETFWKGIKNKTTLIAIAKQLKVVHLKDATATAIRKLLIANVKANGWRPKWLKF